MEITVLAVTYLVTSEEDCEESDNCPSLQKRSKSMDDTDFHYLTMQSHLDLL